MKFFLFLVIFLAFGLKAKAVMNNLGNSSSLQPRVLGGQDVPRQPPWIPSFTLKLNFYYLDPTNHKRVFHGWCGSTVVNERTLLTAAHCIKGTNGHIPPATEVRVLDDDGNEMKDIVGVPIRHHEHNPITRVNDIGLVLLNKALQHRPPVELAVSSSVISNPLCRVLGFGGDGIHQPQWLQFIYLPLASDQICQDGRKRWNAEREMCCQDPTFQSKICPGDSGGPLLCQVDAGPNAERWYQFGVVGHSRTNCQRTDTKYPTYFAKVSYYQKWIKETEMLYR